MRALELKILPGVLVTLTVVLMWLASSPTFAFVLPGRLAIARGLVVAGAVISALAVISIQRARTTVNSLKLETAGSLVVAWHQPMRTREPLWHI